MKNLDIRMRERFLQREEERLFQKELKWIKKEKNRLYHSEKEVAVQRYVHMAFRYFCKSCCTSYLIWVEKGLDEICNPLLKEKSGLPHKPTPFAIVCPNCGSFMHDYGVAFYLDKFEPAKIGDNLFINDEISDCGKPVFNWNGR